MELLDRYLHAVGFWLPSDQRQDIVRELSEDIRSQVEDEEVELGHPLDEDGVEAILRRYGHPMLVAGRFLPQRRMVGPALFPLYAFVLKLFAFCYLVPWLVVWAFCLIFVPTYRAAHPGLEVMVTLRSVWLIALHGFVFVTIAFAAMERSRGAKSLLLEQWNARRLPTVSDNPNRTSRAASVASIVASVVFALWWANVVSVPGGGDVRMAASVGHFYWPVLVLALAGVPLGVLDAMRPAWSRQRAAIHFLIDAAWLVMSCLLLVSGPWLEIAEPAAVDASVAASRWINIPVLVTLVIVAAAVLLRVVQDVRRVFGKAPLRNRPVRFLTGE